MARSMLVLFPAAMTMIPSQHYLIELRRLRRGLRFWYLFLGLLSFLALAFTIAADWPALRALWR